MRSLLFVPADGGFKLEKAMGSGTDAVIIDLEDFNHAGTKIFCACGDIGVFKQASAQKTAPRLLVRINGLDTGITDADLDAIVSGLPHAIVFSSRRRAQCRASRCQADRPRSPRGLAGRPIKILAQAVETAAGLFAAGSFRGASERLIGLTWGPEDLSAELGATANRDAQGN